VGPSSLGVVDLRSKTMLTANAAFDEKELPVGRTFVASHSGSMIGALLTRGKARGMSFAGLVSVGNEVDLSLGEICELMLDDPGIDGYLLFLETMRHARALQRFALAAAERGKPVLAYKLGRSAAARELAVSHTGALAGEDDVADMFLAECGIARVDTLEGLIGGLPLLFRVPAAAPGVRRGKVGVLTTTAGGATMVVDPLANRGVDIEPASAATRARLAVAGIEVGPSRMVDLTVAGARYDVVKSALDILTAAPEFDLVLAVLGSSARAQPQMTARPIIETAAAGKPLAAFFAPEAPEALAMLSRAGVPNFHGPEACADAIAAALCRRAPRRPAVCPRTPAEDARLLDEVAAGALLDGIGIARASAIALDADIVRVPQLPFPYPVAVKVLDAEIPHKADAGGVVLDVGDDAALMAAISSIRIGVAARAPAIPVRKVLVQPMIRGIGEVLVGYRVDRDVGPLVMVAAGGVLAEIARDRSLRLAPVDVATAREMLAELRSFALLTGFRGKPAGDLEAIAHTIVALSQLAQDAEVVEAEINPLIVRAAGEGVMAVDALVRLSKKA
jgi:acyl-CoA synthetase (NDP forming)